LKNRHSEQFLLEMKSGVTVGAKYLALSSRVKLDSQSKLEEKSRHPYDEIIPRNHNSQPQLLLRSTSNQNEIALLQKSNEVSISLRD
jgi:hypothetical protein